MELFINLLKSTWYLWVLLIVISILKPILPKIKGYFGEKSVAFFLSRLDSEKYKIINNLLLQVDNRTTQIDHVVVSNYGIFVIETKNYQGWILGNENDEFWTQIIYKRKEKLYNPIKQNGGHIRALKEVLHTYSDVNYIPIIVFTTKADLKVKTSTHVVYTSTLLRTIKTYTKESISDSMKEGIHAELLAQNIASKENNQTHIQSINQQLTEQKRKIDEDICPKCGGTLVQRKGKYGSFKGCSNYPKCRYTAK